MKRIAVFGLGQFGMPLALALAERGAEVLAFDTNRESVEAVADKVASAVILDCTDERALKAQGLEGLDMAVVAIGENFEANVLSTLLLKSIGVPRVLTRANTWAQHEILVRIGADEVISPEDDAARRLARRLVQPNILDHFGLGKELSLVEMKTPARFVGHSIRDLDLRGRYHVNLVAIEHRPEERKGEDRDIEVPVPDYVFRADDLLFVVGRDEDLQVLVEE